MDLFEQLLAQNIRVVERFVLFRIPYRADAEDVLQETYLAAYRQFASLKSPDAFRPWLLAIARNKCRDYFREQGRALELPLDEIAEFVPAQSRFGIVEQLAVRDVLQKLDDPEKQILYLYYFRGLPQSEIAQKLGVPLGTVKSRLFRAKESFKKEYSDLPKGECSMKKMPEFMPEYTIIESDQQPFAVRWEEIMGWFLVPRQGEKLSWAMYDFPERKRTEDVEMKVIGKAEVHGIEGVECVSIEHDPILCNSAGGKKEVERHFVVQLTDTHCRILAESHMENGVKRYYTFLDGDAFLPNWGFGEDNCGNEVNLVPKGDISRSGNVVQCADKPFLLDIVGRCTVKIAGKNYDTVRVMDVETYNNGVVSEQFLDKNGRTILWRRFNRDDWAFDRYKKLWSEILPQNERLTINGKTYVHWYDCITDYIL